MKQRKQNYLVFLWKRLRVEQRFGVGALLLLLLVFPLALIGAFLPTNSVSKVGGVLASWTTDESTLLYFASDSQQPVSDLKVGAGSTFALGVTVDPQKNLVTTANMVLSFDSSVFEVSDVEFPTECLMEILSNPLVDRVAGTLNLEVGGMKENPLKQVCRVATVTFFAKDKFGDSVIGFTEDTQIAAVGESGSVLKLVRPVNITVTPRVPAR